MASVTVTGSTPALFEPKQEPVLPEGYTLHVGYPPIQDYLHLRRASGLSPKTAAQAAPIPHHSWYGCYVTFTESGTPHHEKKKANESVVAMGRIIGDGGWYFHIADMAVLPAHQRRGLGGAVLRHLLKHIKANAPGPSPGDVNDSDTDLGAYVTLFADKPGRDLYARHGFIETMPQGQMGMMMPMGWENW